MSIIKASEAKAIAQENSIEGIMEEIGKMITKKAEDGKTILQVRDFGFGDSKLYSGKMNEKQEEIFNRLKTYGYAVKVRTEERQFVDIYLEISW